MRNSKQPCNHITETTMATTLCGHLHISQYPVHQDTYVLGTYLNNLPNRKEVFVRRMKVSKL